MVEEMSRDHFYLVSLSSSYRFGAIVSRGGEGNVKWEWKKNDVVPKERNQSSGAHGDHAKL